MDIIYTREAVMKKGFPEIKKLGAVGRNHEMTPFVWNGRLMRLETYDASAGLDTYRTAEDGKPLAKCGGCIRDVAADKIISYMADGCVFMAGFVEGDTMYALGNVRDKRDTIMICESKDLINWKERVLIHLPGWTLYNNSLTKGPDGYVLCLETDEDTEYAKDHRGFSFFYFKSTDLVNWELMDPINCVYSKDRYNGGPKLTYCDGWYYLIAVEMLPGRIFTNYIARTKDFANWFMGIYNPIFIPSNDDFKISPNASKEIDEAHIKSGAVISNSDIDMCEFNGKVYINYACSNQYGFGYMADAEFDGTMKEFLEGFFED